MLNRRELKYVRLRISCFYSDVHFAGSTVSMVFAFFGSVHDHTISTHSTIKSSCCSTRKHCNRFYFIRIEVVRAVAEIYLIHFIESSICTKEFADSTIVVVGDDTIYYNQCIVVLHERFFATKDNPCRTTISACRAGDVGTCYFALQRRKHAWVTCRYQIIGMQRSAVVACFALVFFECYSGSQRSFQHFRQWLHLHFYRLTFVFHIYGSVAVCSDDDGSSTIRSFEHEIAVHIGIGTGLCTGCRYVGTEQSLAQLIQYLSGYRMCFRSLVLAVILGKSIQADR